MSKNLTLVISEAHSKEFLEYWCWAASAIGQSVSMYHYSPQLMAQNMCSLLSQCAPNHICNFVLGSAYKNGKKVEWSAYPSFSSSLYFHGIQRSNSGYPRHFRGWTCILTSQTGRLSQKAYWEIISSRCAFHTSIPFGKHPIHAWQGCGRDRYQWRACQAGCWVRDW